MSWVLDATPECIVGVDIASTQGTSDKTTLDDVMQAAHAIAVDCVIRPPHLGGIVYEAGWQGKLNVVVIAYRGGRRVVDLLGGNGTVDGVETA